MGAGEEVGVVDEFLKKRKVAKTTRRNTKTKARKAIYEQYKDQGVYINYPNCEYLLQQQYMSEEEDMYDDMKIAKAKEVLLEQDPSRSNPFTEKEIMSVLCKQSIDYFEVRVPKYRSPACKELFNLLDSQIANEKAKNQRSGTSNIQSLQRIRKEYDLPIPCFVKVGNLTEESIAWAFRNESELSEDVWQH